MASPAPVPEGTLTAYFFNVGQADGTLPAGPDFTIVVDAGRHNRNDVVPLLLAAGVETISLLVGTHPHADLIGQYAGTRARAEGPSAEAGASRVANVVHGNAQFRAAASIGSLRAGRAAAQVRESCQNLLLPESSLEPGAVLTARRVNDDNR